MITSAMKGTWSSDIQIILSNHLPWHQLSGCRILITGASGFLGGYLTRCLLALYPFNKVDQPIRVVAMVRNMPNAKKRLSDILNNPYLEILEWNLNQISVPNIGSCEYIIHAASQASSRFYGKNPVGTLLPNTVGTAALLEALQQSHNPRGFLFISSSEIYGSIQEKLTLSESDYGTINPATVRACYAESKRLGETLCVAWTEQYKLPTFIVRPFHTYGPGLQANDGRVFADFVFNILRNENIMMMSDGSAQRAFCYVSDAIVGFFTVLFKGNPATPYNVANPAGVLSVMDLANLLVNLYPEKNLKVECHHTMTENAYLPSPLQQLIPDISQLATLGWSPLVTPSQGFQRMIEAYTE